MKKMYNFKNTKKMKKLVFGLIITILLSTASYGQNLRATFLEGKKSHKEIVDAYNKLSDTDQGLLWLEKFNQLLSVNLPKEHHDLIKKLRDDFKDGIDTEQSVTFFGIAANWRKLHLRKILGICSSLDMITNTMVNSSIQKIYLKNLSMMSKI